MEWRKDTVTVSEHSTLPEYFVELGRSLKFSFEIEFSEICMKDSRTLTDEDRKKALEAIEKSDAKKVIITHGMYTMPDIARYLKAKLKNNDKTIVLSGSMVPIKALTFRMVHLILGLQ